MVRARSEILCVNCRIILKVCLKEIYLCVCVCVCVCGMGGYI